MGRRDRFRGGGSIGGGYREGKGGSKHGHDARRTYNMSVFREARAVACSTRTKKGYDKRNTRLFLKGKKEIFDRDRGARAIGMNK